MAKPPSKLQQLLDDQCKEIGRQACENGTRHFCNVQMYARKDLATSGDEREWRCYSSNAVNTGAPGLGCVDNCGNPAVCAGAANRSSSHYFTRPTVLLQIINDNKGKLCVSITWISAFNSGIGYTLFPHSNTSLVTLSPASVDLFIFDLAVFDFPNVLKLCRSFSR